MKAKYLLVVFVILFLTFITIWIISPRVGERVNIEQGIDVEFTDQSDELPEELPEGFVRDKNFTDAVVYRKDNGDKTVSYYEYVGDNNFTYYDINRPHYFVKSKFDRKIYQVKNDDGTLREEYRSFDGTAWKIVSKDYKEVFTVPSNHKLLSTGINVYLVEDKVDDKVVYSYKLLTKIGEKYAWMTPTEAEEWIDTPIPSDFEKTEFVNIYKCKTDKETIYKKVLSFKDTYKTIVVVSCDKNGNFI